MVQISGKVIKGQQYGRVLGFPTANLDRKDFIRQKLKLRFGVYAGSCRLTAGSRKLYKAGIVIGPLDKKGLPKIEAHLINFKGNLYGKKITLNLQKFLRAFKNYKNIEELKKQIQKDLQKVKKVQ